MKLGESYIQVKVDPTPVQINPAFAVHVVGSPAADVDPTGQGIQEEDNRYFSALQEHVRFAPAPLAVNPGLQVHEEGKPALENEYKGQFKQERLSAVY